ncbi:MAG: TIGR02996 domain-containing protein [Archangium sp.]
MSDEFLERIRAQPDDDRLREVYADLLLERGDVRGEFIALQLKRARGQGTTVDLRRERELLNTNWHTWAGPLAKALHRDESTFERGFLAHVTIPRVSTPKKLLAQLPGDPHWATVQSLRNAHVHQFYVPILLHPILKRLTRASMDDDELLSLAEAPWKLEELILRAWDVREPLVTALSQFPAFAKLRSLVLSTTGLDDVAELVPLIEKKIEKLQLFLSEPGAPRPLLEFLAERHCEQQRLDTRTWSLHAQDKKLELVLRDGSPRSLALATQLAREFSGHDLQPTTAIWALDPYSEPPKDWSNLRRALEQAGFAVEAP